MKKKVKTITNTKLFQVTLAAFIFILVVLLIKQFPTTQLTSQEATPRQEANKKIERIEVSGVKVANFFEKAKETASSENNTDSSYFSIARTPDYHIFYFPADELFFISITSYPFDEHRGTAEQKLLEVLAITKEDACKLNVDITTPMFANPDRAGEVYDLSFCSNNN